MQRGIEGELLNLLRCRTAADHAVLANEQSAASARYRDHRWISSTLVYDELHSAILIEQRFESSALGSNADLNDFRVKLLTEIAESLAELCGPLPSP